MLDQIEALLNKPAVRPCGMIDSAAESGFYRRNAASSIGSRGRTFAFFSLRHSPLFCNAMPSDAAKEARFVANPDLETEGTTPLPEDAVTKLRTQLQSETDLLLRKVQHGLLRGGGTDVYTGYSWVRKDLEMLRSEAVKRSSDWTCQRRTRTEASRFSFSNSPMWNRMPDSKSFWKRVLRK